MIKGTRGEYICNICQMLFNMNKNTDPYEPDRGLEIKKKLQTSYIDQTRDSEYETEIAQQFSAYTKLLPTQVLAIYMNSSLYVYMVIKFENEIYELDITADRSQLSAVIRS
jgi:hypothetical protein